MTSYNPATKRNPQSTHPGQKGPSQGPVLKMSPEKKDGKRLRTTLETEFAVLDIRGLSIFCCN